MVKIILANGDSWGYGSEIACPEILNIQGPEGYGKPNRYKPGKYDTFQENDYYRIPRIWPTYLAQNFGAQVVNISWPARCNDNIVASTQRWVFDYLKDGGDPSEVFAVIGWSSPERKHLIIEDLDDKLHYQTMWPAQAEDEFYTSPSLRKFAPFYKQHLFNEAEYLERFITQVYTLHIFLKAQGIKHLFFNAFYHYQKAFYEKHVDLNLLTLIDNMEHDYNAGKIVGWHEETFNFFHRLSLMRNMWNAVPNSAFLFKDTFASFKSTIYEAYTPDICMINMHPSPIGHMFWANFLFDKIQKL